MIKHVVCFKLKNDSIELRKKTKDILLSMQGRVPMLLDLKVGVDFLSSTRSYDIILETYFNNKEDLENYQNDSYHCEVVKTHMHANTTSSIAVDYEIEPFKYEIDSHKIGVDFWNSKKELFEAFYGEFYEFILHHDGKEDLENHKIFNKKDFYAYADWYADNQDSCYAMGFSFHKYYLTPQEKGKIENQPENTFIGYCFKNNKFIDFLNFLITFFAWWRNDEGCTCFNPYNHADEFFHSSWAALVDTSKLFYLTSETVYHWQSFRVKYALDHIPGVILKHPTSKFDSMRVAGYEFLGFEERNQIQYAIFKRKDTYNYWEKEEKTIEKVYIANYKKVDPA